MKKIIIPVLAVSMSLASCNSGSNQTKEPSEHVHDHEHGEEGSHSHEHDTMAETTTSVFDHATTTIGFGAFKTTAKKEVKGWFKNFEVSGITESNEVAEIFKNASVQINVGSLDTKDEGRNATLIAEFFNKTTSNETILGKVISFDDSTAVLSLTFNDVSKELTFNYALSGDTLSMESVLNLEDVNGLEALASINKACESLHKGDDGVSKTWNDVNIYLTTVLKR